MNHLIQRFTLLTILIGLFWFGRAIQRVQADEKESQGCTIIMEALQDVTRLKVGMTRADVERVFTADGGISFLEKSTYRYRKCQFIKIDVEFKKPESTLNVRAQEQADVVTNISKPYLAYPITD